MDAGPYNPLDKINLGISVAEAMLKSAVYPLGGLDPFRGAGIYALYYTGYFEAYAPLAEKNRCGRFLAPIYVGKAMPPGGRKGIYGLDVEPGQALYKRLREHGESVRSAVNLRIEEFYCRFLVLDDIWISLGESMLIARFSPIWNRIIDGFGNHDPGSGRYRGKKSKWDTLHPGRAWADRCPSGAKTSGQIQMEIEAYFNSI